MRDLAELTDIAQYDLVPGLHRIAGVYRVEAVGAKYREYVVHLDPARMLQHKLTPQDVVAGLAKANVIESAGRVLDAHRMLLTVVTTDLHGAEQLAAVPIANVGGQPIYVARRWQRRARHRRGLYPHGLRAWPRGAGRSVAAARR